MANETRKLTKSTDKKLGGVCAGIAEYLGWDITATRVLYLLLSIFSACFPGLIVYIILAILMPNPEDK